MDEILGWHAQLTSPGIHSNEALFETEPTTPSEANSSQPASPRDRESARPRSPPPPAEKKPKREGDPLPLDGMSSGAVRCFNVALFAGDHQHSVHGPALKAWEKGRLIESFIGPDPKKQQKGTLPTFITRGRQVVTDARWTAHFKSMREAKQRPLIEPCPHPKCMMFYFAVLKNPPTSMRAIGAPRILNDWVRPPPSLPLVTVQLLVPILLLFPELHFAEADQKLCFFNYPIVGEDRRYFGVHLEGEAQTEAFAALVMGFRWSPWLQAVVASILCTKAPGLKKKYIISEGPGFIVLRSRNSNGSPGEIAGVIVPFYDNFGVVAGTAEDLSDITGALESYGQRYGIIWKRKHPDDPAFVTSVNKGTFLGIAFTRTATELHFRHTDANIASWSTIKIRPGLSCKAAAELCGIVEWDRSVHLRARRDARQLREIQSIIGKTASRAKWSSPVPLSDDDLAYLRETLDKVLKNVPSAMRIPKISERRFTGSDACDWGRAGGTLAPFSLCLPPTRWDSADAMRQRPIHARELDAAISTIEADINARPPAAGTAYFHLIDNTTAAAGLQRETMVDDWCHDRLQTVYDWRKELGVRVFPVFIGTARMPFDEPSRNEPVVLQKVADATAYVQQAAHAIADKLLVPELQH